MQFRFIEKILNWKYILTLILLLCVLFPVPTFAATLTLSPSSSTLSVGNIATVSIKVNTSGQAINNAEAVIQFPSDMLEVVSLSKSSSIFTLWVEEPSFSNGTGRIVFNGGAANPGFNGSNGTIASIVFKAKKQGTASILFTDGAVRKNDGLGTDILSSKSGSVITVTSALQTPPPTPTPTPQESESPTSLLKPVVVSATHPDQNSWYNTKTVSLNWKIPSNVTSIQTLFNKIPTSTPLTTYDTSVTQQTVTAQSDGIHYFHVRYLGGKNTGPITHYVVKIDSTPPTAFTPKVRIDNKRNIISVDAKDALSGIDHYVFSIDSGEPFEVDASEFVNNEYTLPYKKEGVHTIVVSAYDKAGNHTDATLVYTSPEISAPDLVLSSEEIKRGDTLTITGNTEYSNSKVEVVIENNEGVLGKYIQTTDANGSFTVVTENLKHKGVVTISGQNILAENVRGPFSEKKYLTILETKTRLITIAMLKMIGGVTVLFGLLIALYIGWYKFFSLKRRIDREARSTALDVHTTVIAFKDELSKQLYKLELIKEDRELNNKEEEIFAKIKKNIDEIDAFIEKKLKKLVD